LIVDDIGGCGGEELDGIWGKSGSKVGIVETKGNVCLCMIVYPIELFGLKDFSKLIRGSRGGGGTHENLIGEGLLNGDLKLALTGMTWILNEKNQL
jgi:hypothetical protein